MSASPPSVLAPAATNQTTNNQQQQQQHSSPRMQQQKPAAQGTCPGDGRCNGTGGTSACAGCPTYNNVLNNAARLEMDLTDVQDNSPSDSGSAAGGETTFKNASGSTAGGSPGSSSGPRTGRSRAVGALSCANCKTSTTPLWRRDDAGNNICNACGECLNSHLISHAFRPFPTPCRAAFESYRARGI